MVQTILVYSLLTLFMYVLCKVGKENQKWICVLFAVFLYSIIFGVRFGVGMDYFSYLDAYQNGENSILNKEPGFIFLINFLRSLNAHFSIFFGIVAFVQLALCFRLIKRVPDVYPWLVLTFMLGGQWLVFGNGLRQEVAFAIFVVSLSFLKTGATKKDYLIHFLFILLAIAFHSSAKILILVSLVLIIKKEWFHTIWIQLVVYIIVLFLPSQNNITAFFDRFDFLIDFFGYDRYLDLPSNESFIYRDIERRAGFFITQIINLICICYSNKVKSYYKEQIPVLSIYNLYFFGILWSGLFGGSLVLNRINYYFYQFQFIFSAITMAYLMEKKKENMYCLYLLLICYLLLFVATLFRAETNTALYRFFWEVVS